jgi:hypothetical protein
LTGGIEANQKGRREAPFLILRTRTKHQTSDITVCSMDFCVEAKLNTDDSAMAELKPKARRAKVARLPKGEMALGAASIPRKAETYRRPAYVSQWPRAP